MDKDMHYCAVKALAQIAGFTPEESQTIAYASQYVDDAVEHKAMKISFSDDPPDFIARYHRYRKGYFNPTCTAHRGIHMFIAALRSDVQHKVYVAFHLVPAEKNQDKGPFSYITAEGCSLVRDIVQMSVDEFREEGDRQRKLIRLGIALHTFADTFSHHGFSGRRNRKENNRKKVEVKNNGAWEKFRGLNWLESLITPLFAHGAALALPDISHLEWRSVRGGKDEHMDNPRQYLKAAKEMFHVLRSITGKDVSWEDHEPAFKNCISETVTLDSYTGENSDEFDEKFDIYRSAFPEIEFSYSEDEWRMKALDAKKYDWLRYRKWDYRLRNHKHYNKQHKLDWFYFHIEAYKQREYVLQNIKGRAGKK